MNGIKYYLPALFLLFGITACDNEPEDNQKKEKIGTLTITETTGQGSEKVTTEQQFVYETGKLVRHATTQTFTDLLCQTEYTWSVNTQIGYEPGKVIISDDAGNVTTYLIDDKGRAATCTRYEPSGNSRSYSFSYSPDSGVLNEIKEVISGSEYAETIIVPSSDAGDKIIITGKVDNSGNTYIASTDPDYPGVSNEMSRLPWIFISESYPLSLHEEAFFANILGTPLSALPGRLDMEGSNEVTTYSYTADKKGYVTSCHIRTGTPEAEWNRYIEYSYAFSD